MWILWSALLTGVVIYGVIATILPATTPVPELQTLMLAITVIGLVVTGVVLLGARMIARGTKQYFIFSILRWALSESVAIGGLILHFIGASANVTYAFVGWSIVLFLVLAPRDSDRARFESHLSDRGPGR